MINKKEFNSMSSFNEYLLTIPKIDLLTYGEPSFKIDKEIKHCLVNNILEENDKYVSSNGLISVREEIANYENKKLLSNYNKDEVLITNGATEALYLSMKLLKEKDEVILFSPYYPEYEKLTELFSLKKVVVKLNDTFQIDEKELKNKITKKTKMIIINTPNNPSGVILNENSLSIIHHYVKKYNLYLLVDLVYDTLSYKKMYYPYFEDIKDNLLIVNSLSKSHNLTGWRLGYLLSNQSVITKLTDIKQYLNICVPKFLQLVIPRCLHLKNDHIDEYYQNVVLLYKMLKELKINVTFPDAGYYLFFDISSFNIDSLSFAILLAQKYQIGVIPGIYFHKENYIRISCIKPYKEMMIIQSKLKKALKEIKKGGITT